MRFHTSGLFARASAVGASAVLMAGLVPAGSALAAESSPVAAKAVAPSIANDCNNPKTVSTPIGNQTARYCPIYQTNTSVSQRGWDAKEVGVLTKAGYANWFLCQRIVKHTSGDGEVQYWDDAITEADNGKWGVVSGYYYSGSSWQWPASLPNCTNAQFNLAPISTIAGGYQPGE